MKVLIAGARGQVGRALQTLQPAGVEMLACGREELDLRSSQSVQTVFERFRPEVIVNAAAYTAVDKAESEVDLAREINAAGARRLAEAAANFGARVIHVSTDFVFDGSQSSAYIPSAHPNPLGVYGATKLEGENAVQAALGSRAVVLRTSWVYSPYGKNFLLTIVRLLSEQGLVRVVDDQIGSPTSARSLSATIWRLVERPDVGGVLHWTDSGVASWYDFACAIAEECIPLGLVSREVRVRPIPTSEFPTPAKRPPFSVLDKRLTFELLGVEAQHWREELRSVLSELKYA